MKTLTAKQAYEQIKKCQSIRKEKIRKGVKNVSRSKEKKMMHLIMEEIYSRSERLYNYTFLHEDDGFIITKNIGNKLLELGYDLEFVQFSDRTALRISWDKESNGKILYLKNSGEEQKITLGELLNIMYGN